MMYRISLALALTMSGGRAVADDLDRFIWLHSCPIVERLEIIDANSGPYDLNRFIAVDLVGVPQGYVQCMLLGDGTQVLCEAASGHLGVLTPDGDLVFGVSQVRRAALGSLGFDVATKEGNYQIWLDISGPEDFGDVAALMLSALYLGYGAWAGSALDIVAPLAPGLAPEHSLCTPVG